MLESFFGAGLYPCNIIFILLKGVSLVDEFLKFGRHHVAPRPLVTPLFHLAVGGS